ncbi:MAG TPA: 2-amino-4-hydroxy-6-hydroxymethyldihydropteridine diphosphokinase [Gemmatimonadaceae bacterium]
MAERAFVALGSNLGDRAGYLRSAVAALTLMPASRLLATSAVEETAPFGFAAQGPYLNQMAALETRLSPYALLRELQRIERTLGRVRRERWGARTIDLDLVQLGATTLRSPELTLPHPGLRDRRFWQRELAELGSMLGRAA